ncbi:MAG: hypothetical protein IJW82_05470 [Clostridia bacterium]|nr:hypothetical protein [Clostridia bacterium]
MVYISDRFPSQQKGGVKKGLAEAFSLSAQIAMIVEIICFIIMCVRTDGAMANQVLTSLKYLWEHNIALVLIQFFAFIGVFVFCYLSRKARTDLIAPTYLRALNGVYFVVVLVTTLIFIF